jgi:hypothetical protein
MMLSKLAHLQQMLRNKMILSLPVQKQSSSQAKHLLRQMNLLKSMRTLLNLSARPQLVKLLPLLKSMKNMRQRVVQWLS